MGNKLTPAFEKMQQEANDAKDTKRQIINAYNTDEYIMSQIKKREIDMIKEVSNMQTNELHIPLDEIETLVIRNPIKKQNDKERE